MHFVDNAGKAGKAVKAGKVGTGGTVDTTLYKPHNPRITSD